MPLRIKKLKAALLRAGFYKSISKRQPYYMEASF
jgi:hypothetical protein